MKHWAAQSQVLIASILFLFGGHASAADAYLAHWQQVRARQPPAVSFQISAAKSQFYSGELIPLQLSFASTQPKTFLAETRLQDRVGRMNGTEEFLVDPAGITEDPLRGLPGEGGGMGGLSGGPALLAEKPFTFERLLNEWVRFRKPGKYRIAILSHRVMQVDPAHSEFYLQTHPGNGIQVELVSNILTLQIVPAPAVWVKRQLADALGVLENPFYSNSPNPSEEMRQRRLNAARTLRFLESRDAAILLTRFLSSGQDVDSWSMYAGVLGSPYRKQILPVMEGRLIAPDQPVWGRYLDTLSQLSELVASGGPMDSFPPNAALQAAWRKEYQRRDKIREEKRKEYIARLITSLPAKQPQARVISMNTLIDGERRDGSDASWIPALAASIVADFRSLPASLQMNLIENRWNMIGGPAMLPVLRQMYEYPLEPQPAKDLAVRRIYELAPEEGRQIILSQLKSPDTYLSLKTLAMLPDRSLPELNDALASRLEAGQHVDALVLRYATGDIVQRAELAYLRRNAEYDRQNLPHCGGALIFYFLQQDPAFGEKELRRDMDRTTPFPACLDIGFQFQSLDEKAYSPALERLAIEFLGSPKVPVKRGAAEVLGKYGSPAAQKPLWDTLEYFHSWWKDREAELDEADGREGVQFERALRLALAQANAWILQEDGLKRLLDLCSSNWCRQEVNEWLARAKSPVAIQITPGYDGFQAAVAQYEVHSEEQLRHKVQQFPSGTVFRIVAPLGDNRAGQQAEQIVRSSGYSIASQ
jgi:hypothetical protein